MSETNLLTLIAIEKRRAQKWANGIVWASLLLYWGTSHGVGAIEMRLQQPHGVIMATLCPPCGR